MEWNLNPPPFRMLPHDNDSSGRHPLFPWFNILGNVWFWNFENKKAATVTAKDTSPALFLGVQLWHNLSSFLFLDCIPSTNQALFVFPLWFCTFPPIVSEFASCEVRFHPDNHPARLGDDLDRLVIARMEALRTILPCVRNKNYGLATTSTLRFFIFHLTSLSIKTDNRRRHHLCRVIALFVSAIFGRSFLPPY